MEPNKSDPQTASGSILDRVISSQQTDTLEHFNPVELVAELLKQLNSKEADVLRRRFGLLSGQVETLEVIGAHYQVTRERIRQIQRWAVKRLAGAGPTKQSLHKLASVLQKLIEDNGGVIGENELLESLHTHVPAGSNVKASTLFLLQELMGDKFERVDDSHYKPYWKIRYSQPGQLPEVIAAAAKILTTAGQPMTQADLLSQLSTTPAVASQPAMTDQKLLSFLSIAKHIERNPFGDFGLTDWGSIVPKRMNDKILLVLRKHGKPMHFQDITKRINEIGFDHRRAYPPTVHNELILSRDYVLVGRGIYALRDWGYRPGVVADVVADVLKTAGRPLSRQEIIDQVLAQRMVKKNTVLLALTNQAKFRRQTDGRYVLAEPSDAKPDVAA